MHRLQIPLALAIVLLAGFMLKLARYLPEAAERRVDFEARLDTFLAREGWKLTKTIDTRPASMTTRIYASSHCSRTKSVVILGQNGSFEALARDLLNSDLAIVQNGKVIDRHDPLRHFLDRAQAIVWRGLGYDAQEVPLIAVSPDPRSVDPICIEPNWRSLKDASFVGQD